MKTCLVRAPRYGVSEQFSGRARTVYAWMTGVALLLVSG